MPRLRILYPNHQMNRPGQIGLAPCMRMNRPTLALRKEGDSNPRYGNPHVSLANWWFQPLTHPSSQGSYNRVAKHCSQMRCKGSAFFRTTKTFCKFFSKKFHFLIFTLLYLILRRKANEFLRLLAYLSYSLQLTAYQLLYCFHVINIWFTHNNYMVFLSQVYFGYIRK